MLCLDAIDYIFVPSIYMMKVMSTWERDDVSIVNISTGYISKWVLQSSNNGELLSSKRNFYGKNTLPHPFLWIYDFISSPPVEFEPELRTEADQMRRDMLAAPVSLMQPRAIKGHCRDTKLCRTLFDSGRTCNLMHERAIPKGCPI